MVLHTSVPLQPRIASCVRVLGLRQSSPELAGEALETFTSIRALCMPHATPLDPSCCLPNLSRLIQISTTDIPSDIAQNLTHLYFYGAVYEFIPQLVRHKFDFRRLTHVLMIDSFTRRESISSLEQSLDVLLHSFPHEAPMVLEVVILTFSMLKYTNPSISSMPLEKVQKVIDIDKRIIFWNQRSDIVPAVGNGPNFMNFQSEGRLIEQALGALPDGEIGIWEAAEMWIRRGKETC
ncbi:hypothetical protein DL96DRAFT_1613253 [Flagelloscypha sp. PMI_526]|nr:hypothetical protein DL96DRAFT_1613253 [Flagelloscypha sp. PMI_526]